MFKMNSKNISLLVFSAFIVAAFPVESFASDSNALEDTMCRVLALIQGGLGKGIAAFAVIFLGISLFLGKVSWGVVISTALGIGAIFGAAGIVGAISGDDNGQTTCL